MMNSCDKSSAFSLDPHLKAVSYFIFRLCIPSYRKQKKKSSSILHYVTFTQFKSHLSTRSEKVSTFFVHLNLTPESLVQGNLY